MFTVAVPKKWESDRNRNTGLYQRDYSRDDDPTFFSTDPDPAGKRMRIRIRLKKNADPDPTLNRNEEKIYSYFRV